MKIDPLWRECADGAWALLGPNADKAEVLWAAAVAYLFATGLLSDSNVSATYH